MTFLGWLSDPFKGLSELQLGDEKDTLNHLGVDDFFLGRFFGSKTPQRNKGNVKNPLCWFRCVLNLLKCRPFFGDTFVGFGVTFCILLFAFWDDLLGILSMRDEKSPFFTTILGGFLG